MRTADAWRLAALLLLPPATAEVSHVAWNQKLPTATAAPASGPTGGRASMAYAQQSLTNFAGGAPLADVLWMFGGISSTAPLNYSSELWGYTVSTGQWQSPAPQTNTPPPLAGAAMCSIGNVLYVFGGANFDSAAHNALFSFNAATSSWARMALSGYVPPARAYHAMACTATSVYVFGGEDASGNLLSDTVRVQNINTVGTSWFVPGVTGTLPTARKAHTLTHSNGKFYLFGGASVGGSKLNDAYSFDTATLAWVSLATSGERPTGRDGHTAVVLDEKLYIFGGADTSGNLNDVRVLDLHSRRWSHPRAAGGVAPSPRWGHMGALVNQQFHMFGGVGASQALLSDVWVMSRHCVGRIELASSRGTFTSGASNYLPQTSCSWHLTPSEANRQVRLYFSAFALEAGKDHVAVYDGAQAVPSRLLARLTGASLPLPIGSTTGSLLVVMTTDEAGSDFGFEASFFAECAAGYHPSSSAVAGNDNCAPCPAGVPCCAADPCWPIPCSCCCCSCGGGGFLEPAWRAADGSAPIFSRQVGDERRMCGWPGHGSSSFALLEPAVAQDGEERRMFG